MQQGVVQFTKFAIVGCLNVLVSFAVFYLLYIHLPLAGMILDALHSRGLMVRELFQTLNIQSIDAAFANTIGYVAGMANSFVLNKIWTFEAKGRTARQMHRFVLLNLIGLVISTVLIFIFVDQLGFTYLVVWPVTIALVMILNYTGNKYWTFSTS